MIKYNKVTKQLVPNMCIKQLRHLKVEITQEVFQLLHAHFQRWLSMHKYFLVSMKHISYSCVSWVAYSSSGDTEKQ
jgi:hypothetical protein